MRNVLAIRCWKQLADLYRRFGRRNQNDMGSPEIVDNGIPIYLLIIDAVPMQLSQDVMAAPIGYGPGPGI